MHAYGVAHQPPSFVVPIPGLTPGKLQGGLQSSWQTSAGVEADLPGETSAKATVFHNAFFKMNDVLGISTVGRDSALDQRADGSAIGFEFYLHRRLNKHLGGYLSYTLSRSIRKLDGYTFPSAFDRTHVASGAIAYDLGRNWRAGTRLVFYTGTPKTSEVRGAIAPPPRRAPAARSGIFSRRRAHRKALEPRGQALGFVRRRMPERHAQQRNARQRQNRPSHDPQHRGGGRVLSRLLAWLALGAVAFGCLPKDTRPPPSLVHFTVTPSAATKAGVVTEPTADGWTISFDRVLLALGRASLDGDSCSVYSEASYQRVLTMIGAPDGQKLSDSYALGACDFGFGIANADSDSLLGVGATDKDLTFLRTAGTDHYDLVPTGVSMFVAGKAKKDDQVVTFSWAFRGRARYRQCKLDAKTMSANTFTLAQNGDVTVDVTLHAEALFAEDLGDPASALRFDPIASADALGNQDGDVTLDELSKVPLTALQSAMTYTDPTLDGGVSTWTNLEDFVYIGAAAHVARFEEVGQCDLRLGDMRGD